MVLRKGEILYSGTVHGMSSSKDFFELRSDDNQKLQNELMQHPNVAKVVAEDDNLLLYLSNDLDPAALNRFLFEKGIVLSHLVKRKRSLEQQFLELTNEEDKSN
jgi:ABC-2 type transport system ATP-binding protein